MADQSDFQHHTASFAGGPPNVETLAGHHLAALISAGQHLVAAAGGPFRRKHVRRFDQGEVFRKERVHLRRAAAGLNGSYKSKDTIERRLFSHATRVAHHPATPRSPALRLLA